MAHGLTQESVSFRVEEIIGRQIGSDTPLSPETDLQEDLGMDSLELVELGVALEKEFHIALSNAEVRRCATLSDLTQLILHAESEQEVGSV